MVLKRFGSAWSSSDVLGSSSSTSYELEALLDFLELLSSSSNETRSPLSFFFREDIYAGRIKIITL